MSKFFSDNMSEENYKKILIYYPHLSDVIYKYSREEIISNILRDEYTFSLKRNEINKKINKGSPNILPALQIKNRVGEELISIINKNLVKSIDFNKVYINFDLLKYISTSFLKKMQLVYTKFVESNLKFVFSFDDNEENLQANILKYLIVAEKMYFANLDLYKTPNNYEELTLVMKNSFAAFGRKLNSKGKSLSVMFSTVDENTVDVAYNDLEEKFSNYKKIISCESDIYKLNDIAKQIDGEGSSITLIPYMHPALSGDSFMNYLEENKKISKVFSKTYETFSNIVYKEKNSKVILFKSELLKFYKDRTIGVYSFKTKLTKKEANLFISNMLENFKKQEIELLIYDDTNVDSVIPKLLLYTNKKNSFFLKSEAYVYKKSNIFSEIKDSRLSTMIFKILDELKELYKFEDLESEFN